MSLCLGVNMHNNPANTNVDTVLVPGNTVCNQSRALSAPAHVRSR